MNVIQKITWKNLVKHRGRTILGVIGIILSVSAFTGVATLRASTKDLFIRDEKVSNLDWHVGIRDMLSTEAKKLAEQPDLSDFNYYKIYGYAKISSKNASKPYLYLEGIGEQELKELEEKLVKGRMPENDQELLISSHVNENGRVNWEIGDQIKLKLGNRYLIDEMGNEQQVFQETSFGGIYLSDENGVSKRDQKTNEIKEKIKSTEIKTFKIVGIIERTGYQVEPYSAAGYTAFTKWDPSVHEEERMSVRFRINTEKAARTWLEQYEKSQSQEDGPKIQLNATLFSLELDSVFFQKNNMKYLFRSGKNYWMSMIYSMERGLHLVIVISSVLFIYNIFAISLADRKKNIGILSSIGATKRQRRGSVFFEGFLLCIVGIPFGLLFGTFGIGVVIRQMDSIVQTIFKVNVPFQQVISWNAFGTVLFLTVGTVLMAAMVTLRQADRITPIEAIKGSKEYVWKRRQMCTGKWISRCFGTEGVLAFRNSRRNKKQRRNIVFTITISLALFIGVASYNQYEAAQYKKFRKTVQAGYDFSVETSSRISEEDSEEIQKEIKALSGVKKCITRKYHGDMQENKEGYLYQYIVNTYDDDYLKKYWKGVTGEEMPELVKEQNILTEVEQPYIKKYPEYHQEVRQENAIETIEQYDQEISWEIEQDSTIKQDEIIENIQNIKQREEIEIPVIFAVGSYLDGERWISYPAPKEGEIFQLTKEGGQKIRAKIIKVTEQMPVGVEYAVYTRDQGEMENQIIVPKQYYNQLGKSRYTERFYVSGLPVKTLRKQVEAFSWSIVDDSVSTELVNAEFIREQSLSRFMNVLNFGYLSLICAICTVNLINLITNSMEVRRKEIAMLRSVGMTGNGLYKMLFIENIFYGVKSIMLAVPIGLLINWQMSIEYEMIKIPWGSMIAGIVGVLLVGILTFAYSLSRIRNHNIIEELRIG